MTAKGSGKTCCCNGCEQPPAPKDSSGGLTFFQVKEWQAFCCACIPTHACVAVVKPGSPEYVDTLTYQLYCPALPEGTAQALYKPTTINGMFLVDGVAIDIAVHFVITDGVCKLCLRSYALGITEDTYGACVIINDEARRSPNFFCQRLSNSDAVLHNATDRDLGQPGSLGGIGTEFAVAGYLIRVSRADHIAIVRRPNCIDVYGNQVIDDSPIKNKCCNCDCICRCACLTKRSLSGSYAEVSCLNENNQWSFPSGAIVDLHTTSYSRTCSLRLTPDDPTATFPPDIVIGGDNKCPRVTASWETVIPATAYYPAHSEFYEFSCLKCGGKCEVEHAGCCSDQRTTFPRTLNADITTTCPACPTIGVVLVWDSILTAWVGDAIMCGHPIRLVIGCPFTQLFFSGAPCVDGHPTAIGTPSCSPVLASFSFSTGGIGCCGGSSLLTPTITVVVYE